MSGVLCLSKTHWALQVKSIFTFHTRWPMTLCQPLGAGRPSARISNATPTLYISFAHAFIQKSPPSFLSSSLACSMLVRISIPYVCFVCLIWVFKTVTMTFLLLRVGPTHQRKAGSLSMPLDMAYSAVSIRYDSFISDSFIHVQFMSFHRTKSHHPMVVLCKCHLP